MLELESGKVSAEEVEWTGFDGVCLPLAAGEPRSRRKGKRQRLAKLGPDERLAETLELLHHVCGSDSDRRIVDLLAANPRMTREEVAAALGWGSPATAQSHIDRIKEAYRRYIKEIENPPTTRRIEK